MSIKVMTTVWDHSRMKGSALLLLLAISDFADDEGYAFPGTEILAKKIRMSERQVIRLRQTLYDSGELQYISGGKFKGDKLSVRVTTREKKGDTQGKERVTPMSPDPSLIRQEPSINPQAEEFNGLIHPDAKISPLVFSVLEEQWMTVNPAQLDTHMALVKHYGFENWLRGWKATAPRFRSNKAYVEKVIISNMPEEEAAESSGYIVAKYAKNPVRQKDGSITVDYEGKTVTVPEKWVHKLGSEAEQAMLSVLLTRQSLKHIPS
jgi:hypothetical protein